MKIIKKRKISSGLNAVQRPEGSLVQTEKAKANQTSCLSKSVQPKKRTLVLLTKKKVSPLQMPTDGAKTPQVNATDIQKLITATYAHSETITKAVKELVEAVAVVNHANQEMRKTLTGRSRKARAVTSAGYVDGRRMLSVAEVCNLVGLSKATIYKLIHEKQFIEPVKVSARSTRFPEEEVLSWLSQKEKGLSTLVPIGSR